MKNLKRWLVISVGTVVVLPLSAGAAWVAYATHKADVAYHDFEIFKDCMSDSLVGTKTCAAVHPKTVLFNRTDRKNLSDMAVDGLTAEMSKPFPSDKRVSEYYKIIRPETIITYNCEIKRKVPKAEMEI